MATVFSPLAKPRTSVGAGAQTIAPLGNALIGIGASDSYTVRTAGVASKLFVRVVANDRAASTVMLRVNAANANLTIAIGASTTGEFEDNTNTDTIAAGDEVEIRITVGTGGTTFIAPIYSCLFAATTNTVQRVHSIGDNSVTTASTTWFSALGGQSGTLTTTEANAQIQAETLGTIKNFYVRVITNGRSTSTVVGLRKNGVNGNVLVNVSGGTTGVFEDTTNTDAVAVDDAICMYLTTGTGTGTYRQTQGTSCEFETTNGQWQIFGCRNGGDADADFAASATHYLPIGGTISNDYTTESETQLEPQIAFVASKLQCRVVSNSVTADSTLRFRKNGADGNQVVTITASTTGLFQDGTNSDIVAANDDINLSLVTGGSGTSLNLSVHSMLCFGEQVATSEAANVSAAAYNSAVTLGGVTATTQVAPVALAGHDAMVALGGITASPGAALVALSAFDTTVVLGGVTAVPSAASVTLVAYDPLVTLGGIVASAGVAPVLLSAYNPVITLGGISATTSVAAVILAAYDVASVTIIPIEWWQLRLTPRGGPSLTFNARSGPLFRWMPR